MNPMPEPSAFIATLALLTVVILFALACLIWLAVRKDDIEQALDTAERELQQRPRLGVVHNHMNSSGERVHNPFIDSAP